MAFRKQQSARRQCDIDGVHKTVTAKLVEIIYVRGKRKRRPYVYAWQRDQDGIKACQASVYVRLREVETVLEDTYGGKFLPDDDAGREDLFIVAQHIRGFGGNVVRHIIAFAAMWARWMPEAEAQALAEEVIARPRIWKADSLAKELGVTMERRERLHLTTIGASDISVRKRKRLARKKHAATKAAKRLAAGARPHSESAERMKPWEAEGISRVTYYRRRKAARETNDTDSAEQGARRLGRNSITTSEPSRAVGWPRKEVVSITKDISVGRHLRVECSRSC